jgi:hypothetical protein
MKLPSFIIIGTVKSGSTGLYQAICQHPLIRKAEIKEVHFFDREELWTKGVGFYEGYFAKCKEHEITGEATPGYMIKPHTVAPRIKQVVPNVKLIVLLRNPVTRLFSHINMHYKYLRQWKSEGTLDFSLPRFLDYLNQYLDQLPNPIRAKDLLIRGHYAEQLKEWYKYFPKEQIMIIKAEDFFKAPETFTNEVYTWLNLPKQYISKNNPNPGKYYSKITARFIKIAKAYYAEHNKALYKLLDRDFGWENEI